MTKPRTVATPTSEILVEVLPSASSGDLAPRVLIPEEFKSRALEIADSIAEVVDSFRSRLGKLLSDQDKSGWRARSIEIEFDIALQAEVGVVIAKTTAGATFSARIVLEAPEDKPT